MTERTTLMPLCEADMPKLTIPVHHVRMGATVEEGKPGKLLVAINHAVTLDFGGDVDNMRRISALIADAADKITQQGNK